MSKDIKKMLEEKLRSNNERHAAANQSIEFDEGRTYDFIDVSAISPNPYQPRRTFPQAELEKLASSISEIGLLEPILLRKIDTERYEIAAGERRWRAHKLLNKPTIGAIITGITDSDMAVFAIAENLDREDLSDYEIGIALRRIQDIFPTMKKLAESLGLNRQDMYKYFSFDELPKFMRDDLDNNPRLLSRSAASEIKRLLTQHKESFVIDDLLREAWDLLLNNELDQTKIPSYINKKLRPVEPSQSENNDLKENLLSKDGKKIGQINWTSKHLNLQINSSALTMDKEMQLKEFLAQLLSTNLKKI
jgi:ParB family transcriptional regulator, chromosome partitioning protein